MLSHPSMPDFAQGYCGFHHTLDSALAILSDLNVSPARVTVRMAGHGYPARWVVRQSPPPGSALDPGVNVHLSVAGIGYFHALPVGMWDTGGEVEPGTQEIVELLDDPLQKATHWVREGASLFDIQPENLAACSRWISLFGLSPDAWPAEIWYKLAVMLPSIQSLAGAEHGIRFMLQLLLGLPLKEIRRSPAFRRLKDQDCTRLGEQHCRLGVESIVGDRKEDLAKLTLIVGPVTLKTYYEFVESDKRELLDAVLGLVTNCYQEHIVSWVVDDPRTAPRLDHALQNAILGINSHLGGPTIRRARYTSRGLG
jgi:hypothetical protein